MPGQTWPFNDSMSWLVYIPSCISVSLSEWTNGGNRGSSEPNSSASGLEDVELAGRFDRLFDYILRSEGHINERKGDEP